MDNGPSVAPRQSWSITPRKSKGRWIDLHSVFGKSENEYTSHTPDKRFGQFENQIAKNNMAIFPSPTASKSANELKSSKRISQLAGHFLLLALQYDH